jgi:hypothetical protein
MKGEEFLDQLRGNQILGNDSMYAYTLHAYLFINFRYYWQGIMTSSADR